MNKPLLIILAVVAITLIAASQIFFIVDQREQAIVLQLGQPVGNTDNPASFIKGPGLHAKIPFVQNVVYFDRRILAVDPPADQMVISSSLVSREDDDKSPPNLPATQEGNLDVQNVETNEDAALEDPLVESIVEAAPPIQDVSGEPIIVDTFARYKIVDPLQFLKTLRTISNANMRLETILNDATRAVLGRTTLKELLSVERTNVMADIRRRVNRKITNDQLGIEIVDVRIVRADLTADLRTSTVRRMISELRERATETRAKGEERALEIRSRAEKERTVLIADAEREAQVLRGQGDKEAIQIYADAFNKDKDFYSFIRSMEAYEKTLADPETQLILSPNSPFFKHFGGQ